MRRTSSSGRAFVALHEGFREQMYDDVAGKCTIGFGHLVHHGATGTNPAAEEPFVCGVTEAVAAELLAADLAIAEDAVNQLVRVPLRQAQFDALVSFTYNFGRGNLANSTLLRKLNAGFCCAVPAELRRWVKARRGGKLTVFAGLVARRDAEAFMWAEGGDSTLVA